MAKVQERPITGTTRDDLGRSGAALSGIVERARGVLFPPRRMVDTSPRTTDVTRGAGKTTGNAADAAADDQRVRQRGAQRGDMMKMMRGLLAYVVGSIVIQYGVVFADNQFFHQYLQKHVQTLFPTTWPLVGTMTWYALIYILLLITLVWGLYHFNVMPRNFGASQAARRNAPPPTTTTLGRGKTAQKRAATAVSASPSTAKGTTVRRPATPARTVTANDSDESYDRVRALQQRARKRKR
jgi:hypothetical protein